MIHRFHVYQCESCVAVFAGEDHEELDHSVIVCPFCKSEDSSDIGSGEMEVVGF